MHTILAFNSYRLCHAIVLNSTVCCMAMYLVEITGEVTGSLMYHSAIICKAMKLAQKALDF